MRTVRLFLLIFLCLSSGARAATYQFTFEGVVTRSVYPNVDVDEPFTVSYTVDSTDLDSRPAIGLYAASRAVAVLPRKTLTTLAGSVHVVLSDDPFWGDQVYYNAELDVGSCDTDVRYPPATLGSDVLPLALPLEISTRADWQYGGELYAWIAGTITDISITEVPEPSRVTMSVLTIFLLGRRQGLNLVRVI
jgi:hypothetical protein